MPPYMVFTNRQFQRSWLRNDFFFLCVSGSITFRFHFLLDLIFRSRDIKISQKRIISRADRRPQSIFCSRAILNSVDLVGNFENLNLNRVHYRKLTIRCGLNKLNFIVPRNSLIQLYEYMFLAPPILYCEIESKASLETPTCWILSGSGKLNPSLNFYLHP